MPYDTGNSISVLYVSLEGRDGVGGGRHGTHVYLWLICGFPGGSGGKESTCNMRDPGSIPESGRTPGEGNGNPLQYSCLENSMDREAWWLQSMESQRVAQD